MGVGIARYVIHILIVAKRMQLRRGVILIWWVVVFFGLQGGGLLHVSGCLGAGFEQAGFQCLDSGSVLGDLAFVLLSAVSRSVALFLCAQELCLERVDLVLWCMGYVVRQSKCRE